MKDIRPLGFHVSCPTETISLFLVIGSLKRSLPQQVPEVYSQQVPEVYSQPSQPFKMNLSSKLVNGFSLDVSPISGYTCEIYFS